MQVSHQIDDNNFYLEKSQAIVSFASTSDTSIDKRGNGGKAKKITYEGLGSFEIWAWGANNDLPADRERLVMDNNIVGELMRTKRDITLGSRLYCYKEEFAEGEYKRIEVAYPKDAQAFFDKNSIKKYLRLACRNLIMHAVIPTEMVRELGGKIASLEALECRHVRPEVMNKTGDVKNWFWCGNWPSYTKPNQTVQKIQTYSGEEKRQNKFMWVSQDDILTDDILAIPTWWGGRMWVELANLIPKFHLANLKNGYSIRFHIEIPKGYFYNASSLRQTEAQRAAAKKGETEQREALMKRLNEFFAGEEQAGRAMVTSYDYNEALGREIPGIKITPLNFDMKDEALLKLFAATNDANISGQGVHPTLAAIQTQGKLSSGSEIRNAFLMYVAIKTPVNRDLLLEPIELIHKINGWGEGLKWGFKDIEITTLDENPKAMQEANPNPATTQ